MFTKEELRIIEQALELAGHCIHRNDFPKNYLPGPERLLMVHSAAGRRLPALKTKVLKAIMEASE